MAVYQVNRLIYTMKMDASLAERFRSDRGALLKEWDLTDDERRAVEELDFDWLRRAGVVPNLLLRLTSIAGVPLTQLTHSSSSSKHETE